MAQQRPHDENFAQNLKDMLGFASEPHNDKPAAQPEAGAGEPPDKPPVTDDDQNPPPEESEKESGFKFDKEKMLRILWTTASVISMTVNVIVLIVVVVLLRYAPVKEATTFAQSTVKNMPPEIGLNTPVDLLQGLYDNFELMDKAHIETTIPVTGEIPVEFTLELNENTTVVLSEPVTIPGARVALTTGGLNIFNAPATVTLPADTELPIRLNLDVPVNVMIPIALDVPVDIALSDTDLHDPFVGLQDVVRPLYCLVKSDAINADGEFICLKETVE